MNEPQPPPIPAGQRPPLPRPGDNFVLLGLNGTVTALSKSTGKILWSAGVKGGGMGSSFVTLACDDERVYAYRNGWVSCLDLLTGRLLWNNGLEGYGYGFGSICVPGHSTAPDAATMALIAAEEQAAHSASSSAH